MVELLVSIGIFTVIMAGMFAFLWGASLHWQTGQNMADINENARLGLNRMTREIKQSSEITEASTSQVQFDVNFGTYDETVTYGFTPGYGGEPGTLWRESSLESGQQLILMDNVDSVTFEYFGNDYRCDEDQNGTVTYSEVTACDIDSASIIARVDIALSMRADSSPTKVFLGQAWLRNRVVQ